jgi:hypothetical protein
MGHLQENGYDGDDRIYASSALLVGSSLVGSSPLAFEIGGSISKSFTRLQGIGEDDFVSAVKGYKPDITKEELQEWIMRFRAAVREKRGPS